MSGALKITLQGVAREAGVSLATADRVINRRAGVRGDTVERVRAWTFDVVLPSGPNAFMAGLKAELQAVAKQMRAERMILWLKRVDVFDGAGLAAAIGACGADSDGLAVVALDHPAVREVLDRRAAQGLPLVTLVSDVPAARRQHLCGDRQHGCRAYGGQPDGSLLARRQGARRQGGRC